MIGIHTYLGVDTYNTMAGIHICALKKCNSTQFIFPFLSPNRVQWIKTFLQCFVLFWFCLIFIILYFFLLLFFLSFFLFFFFYFSLSLSFALVMFVWLHFRCHNYLHWPPQHIHAEQVRTGLLLALMPASFEWGLVAWWAGWFEAWWSRGSLLCWFDGMYLSYITDNFKVKTTYM